MHAATKIYVLCTLFMLAFRPCPGYAQPDVPLPDLPQPQEEAPPTIFQTQLGSADVSLILTGFWETTLLGSLGYGISPVDGSLYPVQFPGMTQGVLFKQVPSITALLWLNQKYFFKASVEEGYALNSLVLGYNGSDEDFLKRVRIGNTDVGMANYGLLQIPEAPPDSIGASALFSNENSQHEFMLRFDATDTKEQTFIGKDEVSEQRLAPSSYMRGRRIILPDDNVENLQVLVETTPGDGNVVVTDSDGRTYGTPAAGTIITSAARGTITITGATPSRVIVYYTKNGVPVGDASLGKGALCGESGGYPDPSLSPEDFSFTTATYLGVPLDNYRVVTPDRNYLLVYDDQTFTPFESLGTYQVGINLPQDTWRTKAYLGVDEATPATSDYLNITTDSSSGTVTCLYDAKNPRDPANKYPLAALYPELYGPNRETAAAYTDRSIVVQVRNPVDAYQLDSPIPGSVRVLRNDEPETAFTVDSSGVVTFLSPVSPDDRIEITYRTAAKDRSGGNLVFGYGSSFTLSPSLNLNTGIGLNWNVYSGRYTTSLNQDPGTALAQVGASYQGKLLSASLNAGVVLRSPDTTGVFRLLGMEDQGIDITFPSYDATPAAPPLQPPGGLQSLTRYNRGKLFYKDYNSYDATGAATLEPYDWASLPADQIYPYADGSPPGPYVAAPSATDTITTNVLVMDYAIAAGQNWVGAQIPLATSGGPLDLSNYQSLTFTWKGNVDSALHVYLQIGSISEDLDGDGKLDAETDKYSDGYAFNDPSNGVVLRIGGGRGSLGNGKIDTEDTDGNGVLDAEVPDRIVTSSFASGDADFPSSTWKRVEIDFTQAERQKLTGVTSIRIIVASDGSQSFTGKLLLTDLSLNGSPFTVNSGGAGTVSAQEVAEHTQTPAIPELETAFPETKTIFHPSGEEQRVLKIQWSNSSTADNLSVKGLVNEVSMQDYGKVVFYLLPSEVLPTSGSTAECQVSLLDSSGKGLVFSFPVSSSDTWHKYVFDYRTMTLTVDGSEITPTEMSYQDSAGYLRAVTIDMTGTTGGTVYIDEVYLRDSRLSVGAGVQGSLDFKPSNWDLTLGTLKLISGVHINEEAAARTVEYQNDFDIGAGGSSLSSSTSIDAVVLYTGLQAKLDYQRIDGENLLSGSHNLSFPSFKSPVVFSDSFSLRRMPTGPAFSKSDQISVNAGSAASMSLSSDAYTNDTTLVQDWNLTLDAGKQSPLSFTLNGSVGHSADAYPLTNDGYFKQWFQSYLLLVPWTGGISPERSMKLSPELDLNLSPFAMQVKSTLAYTDSEAGAPVQNDNGNIEIDFPIVFNKGSASQWSFTSSIARSFSLSGSSTDATDYAGDLTLLGQRLATQHYVLSPPIYDLFAQSVAEQFGSSTSGLAAAAYTPSISFGVSRQYGSYLRDLLLPSDIQLTLKRQFTREDDLVSTPLDLQVQLRTLALNLFGSRGAYSLTSAYATDEFTSNITFSATSETATLPESWNLIVQHSLMFYGATKNQLSFDNRLSIAQDQETVTSDDAAINFTWYVPVRRQITIPLVNIKVANDVYLKNAESADVWVRSDHGEVGVRLKHSTALLFGTFGSIEARLSLGIDTSNPSTGTDSGRLLMFGVEGGITAKITF